MTVKFPQKSVIHKRSEKDKGVYFAFLEVEWDDEEENEEEEEDNERKER